MAGGGLLLVLGKSFGVLVEDVTALVRSEAYKDALVRCLCKPHDRKALEGFLALDNFCRDLPSLVPKEELAAVWEARALAFDGAWNDIADDPLKEGPCAIEVSANRMLLRTALDALAGRTPDDVYEYVDKMLLK
jgi:hypothetical protein